MCLLFNEVRYSATPLYIRFVLIYNNKNNNHNNNNSNRTHTCTCIHTDIHAYDEIRCSSRYCCVYVCVQVAHSFVRLVVYKPTICPLANSRKKRFQREKTVKSCRCAPYNILSMVPLRRMNEYIKYIHRRREKRNSYICAGKEEIVLFSLLALEPQAPNRPMDGALLYYYYIYIIPYIRTSD